MGMSLAAGTGKLVRIEGKMNAVMCKDDDNLLQSTLKSGLKVHLPTGQ